MESKPDKLVVIMTESVVASFLKDIFTFALLGGLMYFNHRVLNGSTWVDVIFIIMALLWVAGKANSKVFEGNKADAIKWLEGK